MSTKVIGRFTIEHHGDVDKGLAYIEKNFDKEDMKEKFELARKASDQDAHFNFSVDGVRKYYILKHIGYDRYSLKWVP